MFDGKDRDKLSALTKRIDAAKEAVDPVREKSQSESAGGNRGVVKGVLVGSDLLASVLGLGFCGWIADRQFGTAPWLMLVMVVVGFVAGFWIVLRAFGSGSSDEEDDHGKKTE